MNPRVAEQKAWERYLSTVRCGGTPQQRRWAFDIWSKADDKAARAERPARPHKFDPAKESR